MNRNRILLFVALAFCLGKCRDFQDNPVGPDVPQTHYTPPEHACKVCLDTLKRRNSG